MNGGIYIITMGIILNIMFTGCISQNKGVINNENKIYFGSIHKGFGGKESSMQLSNIVRETVFENNEINKGGDVKMEADISNLITVITSAIAGVYCAIKTIINLIKKVKQ